MTGAHRRTRRSRQRIAKGGPSDLQTGPTGRQNRAHYQALKHFTRLTTPARLCHRVVFIVVERIKNRDEHEQDRETSSMKQLHEGNQKPRNHDCYTNPE